MFKRAHKREHTESIRKRAYKTSAHTLIIHPCTQRDAAHQDSMHIGAVCKQRQEELKHLEEQQQDLQHRVDQCVCCVCVGVCCMCVVLRIAKDFVHTPSSPTTHPYTQQPQHLLTPTTRCACCGSPTPMHCGVSTYTPPKTPPTTPTTWTCKWPTSSGSLYWKNKLQQQQQQHWKHLNTVGCDGGCWVANCRPCMHCVCCINMFMGG